MKVRKVLDRSLEPLTSTVVVDEFVKASEKAFDCEFNGRSEFYGWELPDDELLKDFSIGVIVGGSGTGKSTLLKEFGNEYEPYWEPYKAIVSHFQSPDDAINKLSAVGLNTVPSWYKQYQVLSNGEKFRADLARKVKNNAVIDEFTSVVDRNVAKAASVAMSRYVKNNSLNNIVISTCHHDVVDWLEPDWVINTDLGHLYDGFFFVRPELNLEIYKADRSIWGMFKEHHYLSGDLSNASRCYVGVLDGKVVGFSATMTMPNGNIKNAWREHRTVIIPDYQGLGLGVRFSDAIGQIHLEQGHRFYSRTAHIRMGYYREQSTLWKPTSKNKVKRVDITNKNTFNNHYADNKRVCFSHEYIGPKK